MLKALYGMVQAGYIWYQTLLALYILLSYKVLRSNPVVCSQWNRNTFNIQSVHTDDVLAGASYEAEAHQAMKEFSQTYDPKNVEDVHLITGLTIKQLPDGSISITQASYLVKVLQHFDLWISSHLALHCNPIPVLLGRRVRWALKKLFTWQINPSNNYSVLSIGWVLVQDQTSCLHVQHSARYRWILPQNTGWN